MNKKRIITYKINAIMWNYQKNNPTKFPEALNFYHMVNLVNLKFT